MVEDKNKKNNWTKKNIDEVKKKINREIYKRNKQSSLQIKLDDLAIYINDRITITASNSISVNPFFILSLPTI